MTQSKPVLCLGEALIDVVIRDDTRSEHVGGSPLNVACVITSLGRPALIGAWWGRDDHGKLIEDYAADHAAWIRINLATSPDLIREGVRRVAAAMGR